MEIHNVLPHMVSFTGPSSLKQVSSQWRQTIRQNDRDILESLNRFAGSIVYEKILSVMEANDLQMLQAIAIDYQGYLPVNWDHLQWYIKNKEQYKILKGRIGYMHIDIKDKYAFDENLPNGISYTDLDTIKEYLQDNNVSEDKREELITKAIYQGDEDILQYTSENYKPLFDLYIDKLSNGEQESWIKIHSKSMEFMISKGWIPLKIQQLWRDDPNINLRGELIVIVVLLNRMKIYERHKNLIGSLMRNSKLEYRPTGFDVLKDLLDIPDFQQELLMSYLGDNDLSVDVMLEMLQQWLKFNRYDRSNIDLLQSLVLYPEVLDKYLTPGNAIELLIKMPMSSSLYKLLQYKGFHPEWFRYYLDDITYHRINVSDTTFWKKLVSQASKDNNIDLMIRIIRREKPSDKDLDSLEKLLEKEGRIWQLKEIKNYR